jgi:hypothetical protein
MNSYEISACLETLGYEGNNATQAMSMMHLTEACAEFQIPFCLDFHDKCSLYGHVGHYRESADISVWFILLDREEIDQHPGCSVKYSLHGKEADLGAANGPTLKQVYC